MKVVATPTRESVLAGFAFDLTQLLRRTPDAVWAVAQGSLLCNLRSTLVENSLTSGASHILFIDSDMRFPATALNGLVMRGKPIIGANCRRRDGSGFTAQKDGSEISSHGASGIQKVDTIGFGVTLIQMSVFEKMQKPWFAMPFDGDKMRW